MSRFIPDTVVVASLPVATWAPAPASIAFTEDGDFIVTLEVTQGCTHERRFPLAALTPPRSNDAAGSIVLAADGERLVLAVGGNESEIMAFADAIAPALRHSGSMEGTPRGR